jgi:hypothetical protein
MAGPTEAKCLTAQLGCLPLRKIFESRGINVFARRLRLNAPPLDRG